LHGIEILRFAWHVGRPELRTDDSLLQADQIGLPLRTPTGIARQVLVEREVVELRAAAVFTQIPRKVVVPGKLTRYWLAIGKRFRDIPSNISSISWEDLISSKISKIWIELYMSFTM
jgi:hypothetical protein